MQLVKPYQMFEYPSDNLNNVQMSLLEKGIRQLIIDSDMKADGIDLRFENEPDFFRSLDFFGDKHKVVYALFPGTSDRISSLGIHSTRTVFLDGLPSEIAYIHHLRIHPEKRGGNLLYRGYQAFRQAAGLSSPRCTITSILAENTAAVSILENPEGRGSLPSYKKICKYLTAIFPVKFPLKRWPLLKRSKNQGDANSSRNNSGLSGRMLTAADSSALVALFSAYGKINNGVPYIDENKLKNNQEVISQLKISDFFGLFHENELVAATGFWDQNKYKQIILRRIPFFLKFFLKLFRLYPENGKINLIYLDPWAFKPDLEKIYSAELFRMVFNELSNSDYTFAAWGAPENHPACREVMKKMIYIPYRSFIYTVEWPETSKFFLNSSANSVFPLGML
ncbi:MAG: hypothetical protein HQM10_21605 [Candidatus Riflebacteria bacterium]|nr:hypothetical protein [Candidatus Riflebacteria bacterium]